MQYRTHDTIAVVDFGGQLAHKIVSTVRKLGVYAEFVDPLTNSWELGPHVKGVIVSGGAASVYAEDAPLYNQKIFDRGPLLGICYGHQLIGHKLGGKVEGGQAREFGPTALTVYDRSGLFAGLGKEELVWMSHGDTVTYAPPGFTVIGRTPRTEIAAMADFKRNIYGLQFHPEAVHTRKGARILSNFVDICACKRTWRVASHIPEILQKIQKQVGKRNVHVLVSGGVDSTVAAMLIEKAVGPEQVYALFIDTGFMRKNEASLVTELFMRLGFKNFFVCDASHIFYKELGSVTDPEEKRRLIGKTFIEVEQQELQRLGLHQRIEEWLLGQGTIYPDTIETGGTRHAMKIKTHHNRAPIVAAMIRRGKVVEPLKDFYKDEVRAIGKEIGLDDEVLSQHPFPGPGLATRTISSDRKAEDISSLSSRANVIGKKYGFEALALPIRSVGVQGDMRSYAHPVVLSGKLNWQKAEAATLEITNSIPGINRVVYAIAPKKIKSIELMEGYPTRKRVKIAQEADYIVSSILKKHGLWKKIDQCPVVLAPVSVNKSGLESIVIRPVNTTDFMTASVPRLPEHILEEIASELMMKLSIGAVFYDITTKPPGTIEWE